MSHRLPLQLSALALQLLAAGAAPALTRQARSSDLDVLVRTVERRWRFLRAWLAREIEA